MITKVARYRVRHDKIAAAVEATRMFVEAVHMQESSTLRYDAWQEHADPTRFLHLMVFRDEVAEAHHRSTPHVRAYVETLHPLCSEQPAFVDLDAVAVRLP